MHSPFNLNSLTDIVSNAIGMAVLFALIGFLNSETKAYSMGVPVERETTLAPVFFLCKDDAIMRVDRGKVLRELTRLTAQGETEARATLALGEARLEIELTDAAGFVVHVEDTTGWEPMAALTREKSRARAWLDAVDPSTRFAFFFVYDAPHPNRPSGSGYDVFREARAHIKEAGVKVGWTTADEENPPHICSSPSQALCHFRPSYQ